MLEFLFWLLLAVIIPSWVVEAEAYLSRFVARGYTGSVQDIEYLGVLERTFGKESEKWLALTQEVSLHDAVFFLPGRKVANDLKQWLFKNGHLLGSKPALIRMTVQLWEQLTVEQRKQIADASQLSANHIELLVRYGEQVAGLKGKKLVAALDKLTPSALYPKMGEFGRVAEKAYGGSVPLRTVAKWYCRWLQSLSVPESPLFPVGELVRQGKYSLRFVPRANPERLFAGSLTNCCQHPNGEGTAAAWYAQKEPNGGLLALYKDGQMIAQSFMWCVKGAATSRAVLDNVEALSTEAGDKLLLLWAQTAVARTYNWSLGQENNDVSKQLIERCFEDEEYPIIPPRRLNYSDAFEAYQPRQVLLRNPEYGLRPCVKFEKTITWGCILPIQRDATQVAERQAAWKRAQAFGFEPKWLRANGFTPNLSGENELSLMADSFYLYYYDHTEMVVYVLDAAAAAARGYAEAEDII